MFNFGEEEIKRLFMNCLMVVGGYLVGYVFGMLAAIGFDKLVTHRKSPDGLHKVVRALCGLIVAILVALLVFRGGGGGSGEGNGPGTNENSQTGGPNTPATDPKTKSTDPIATNASVTVEVVRVKVLAGDEVEKGTSRFYQVGDSMSRVDRAAVVDAITERKKGTTKTLVVVYEFGREAGPGTIAFAELKTDMQRVGLQLMSDDEYRAFVKR